MQAVMNGHQTVTVLEVGRLSSRVHYRTRDGDNAELWTQNTHLKPEPCGACLGKGCKACEGRGHDPRKSMPVLELGNTLGAVLRYVMGSSRRKSHIIDAEECAQEHFEAGRCPECTLELHEGECP